MTKTSFKTAAKRTKEMKGREKKGGMRMKERLSKYGLLVIVDSGNGLNIFVGPVATCMRQLQNIAWKNRGTSERKE